MSNQSSATNKPDAISPKRMFVAQAVAEFKESNPRWCADPANLARLQSAADLAQSGWIERTDKQHRFIIPSNSTMGAIYSIDRQARSCTCPDFRYRFKIASQPPACKHRIAVHLAVRAMALEFEFLDWSKAFENYWVSRGTDDEAEAYARLAGWDSAPALAASCADEAHADAIAEMGGRLPQ